MTTREGAPRAVPGFERLRWREPVSIPIEPGHHYKAQIVARGDDAGIVYATKIAGEPGEYLTTCTLDGAFVTWPPRIGAPVRHDKVDLACVPPQLAAWSNDEVIVWSGNPRVLSWNREPSSRPFLVGGLSPAPAPATGHRYGPEPDVIVLGPKREHGVFVHERVEGRTTKLLHRDAEGSVVTELAVPPRAGHLVVLDDGGVLAVSTKQAKKGNPLHDLTLVSRVTTVRLSATSKKRNAFDLPAGAAVRTVIPANGGGAWLCCWRRLGEVVIRLDGSGKPVGTPWLAPYASSSLLLEICPWREGFVICVAQGGIALIASDGVFATRVEGPPEGVRDISIALHSMAISTDGRAILVCHHTPNGLRILRADFEGASSGEALPDPWEAQRVASAKLAAHLAARANEPPPLPGRRMEVGNDGAPAERCHAKERIVRQVRVRHVLQTIAGLNFGELSRFRGNAEEGEYMRSDDTGNHVYFAWSRDGLVGASFDHDQSAPEGRDANAENAPYCFPEIPASLTPLMKRAIAATRGAITGGLWVTTGETARWCEEGSFTDDFAAFTMLPEIGVFARTPRQSWLELSSLNEAQGRLAISLAEKSSRGPHTLTEDEEAILLTRPSEWTYDAKYVAEAVRAFAAIGITWVPRQVPRA